MSSTRIYVLRCDHAGGCVEHLNGLERADATRVLGKVSSWESILASKQVGVGPSKMFDFCPLHKSRAAATIEERGFTILTPFRGLGQ